jgi:hypothetical protein
MATYAGPGRDPSRGERARRSAPQAMVFAPSPLLTKWSGRGRTARPKPTITASSLLAIAQVSHSIEYSGGTGSSVGKSPAA